MLQYYCLMTTTLKAKRPDCLNITKQTNWKWKDGEGFDAHGNLTQETAAILISEKKNRSYGTNGIDKKYYSIMISPMKIFNNCKCVCTWCQDTSFYKTNSITSKSRNSNIDAVGDFKTSLWPAHRSCTGKINYTIR